ncbi:hypothetical protein Q8A73_017589 [Channa argus]|nr:hypothetical protein Q8A73_017589 [Channa argus]
MTVPTKAVMKQLLDERMIAGSASNRLPPAMFFLQLNLDHHSIAICFSLSVVGYTSACFTPHCSEPSNAATDSGDGGLHCGKGGALGRRGEADGFAVQQVVKPRLPQHARLLTPSQVFPIARHSPSHPNTNIVLRQRTLGSFHKLLTSHRAHVYLQA